MSAFLSQKMLPDPSLKNQGESNKVFIIESNQHWHLLQR
jgi:hypothetical protein